MKSQIIREIKETDYPVLVGIWESAVLHTHDFLKQEDFLYYKENLINYFRYVSLYGFEQDQKLVGFIGTANSNIEMLFVHNDYRSMGIGKKLVLHAIHNLSVSKVDVNEQNLQAIKFYQHIGFSIVARSAVDGEGMAYPILHMQLSTI